MEIKPIESFNIEVYFEALQNTPMCITSKVRQLEVDFKEAIEALEKLHKKFDDSKSWGNFDSKYYAFMQITRPIIEKAYGEKWEDIRREK